MCRVFNRRVFVSGLLAGGDWLMPVGGIGVSWLLVIAVQLLLPVSKKEGATPGAVISAGLSASRICGEQS